MSTIRRYPHVDVRKNVRNQSERAPGPISLIVLHDTEGANIKGVADLQGLANWFDNPAAQASSHVAVDGEGHSARFVRDHMKAWHVAAYNSVALGIEQVGFASQTRSEWPENQLRETARWCAYWSRKWGIPLHRGQVGGFGVIRAGVVLHSDLGQAGGGHRDPGPGYPFHWVMHRARHFRDLMDQPQPRRRRR